MIPAFKRIRTKLEDLTRLQDEIERIFLSFKSLLILNGTLLTDLELTSGSNTVSHGLGRVPNGYFLASSDTASFLALTSKDSNFLVLSVTSDSVISLWVF